MDLFSIAFVLKYKTTNSKLLGACAALQYYFHFGIWIKQRIIFAAHIDKYSLCLHLCFSHNPLVELRTNVCVRQLNKYAFNHDYSTEFS